MTATEMHDLLRDAFVHIAHEQAIFQPGTQSGFSHINYCRFCSFSENHVAAHGHGESCLYARLKRATESESVTTTGE
jgi:hypothetical protein